MTGRPQVHSDRPLTHAEKSRRYAERHPARVKSQHKEYIISGKSADYQRRFREQHPTLQWIRRYKDEHCCMDCDGRFPPECMDFDHVRGDKAFTISNSVITRSLEEIKAEIEKCDLVCANCHRVRTMIRVRERQQALSTKLLQQALEKEQGGRDGS